MADDPLKEHFIRTVARGPELPEKGEWLGDPFVLVGPDGTEVVHAWDGRRWISAEDQSTPILSEAP